MRNDPWEGIASDASQLLGRRVDGEHVLSVYWVRGVDSSPGVVFRKIDADAVPTKLPRFKGLAVRVAEGFGGEREIQLFLASPRDREIFSTLCRDVVDFSSRANNRPAATAAVFTRLGHWQHLLSRGAQLEMSPPEVRGLIGELLVLLRAADSRGIHFAISAWVAPDDHPQDFAFPDRLLEVKARLAGSRQQVQISSLEQLDRGNLPIFLVVLELAPADGDASRSLADLVDHARSLADSAGTDCRNALEGQLLRRGYLDLEIYSVDRYQLSGERAFRVVDGFPGIVRSKTDLRIRQATYLLDIPSLDAFACSIEDALYGVDRS